MKSRFLKIILVLFVVTLTACEEVAVVHELGERDANEILVMLHKSQIKATKEAVEKNQEVTWTIKVKPEFEQDARAVLVANNLPRVRLGGLKGICQDAGLILTPKTEKCRELLAYKEEVINLLETIECVISADVVLNIPEKIEFADEDTPQPRPTSTVAVRYRKDCVSGSQLTEGRIQEAVSNSISGLDPRDVSVLLSYVDTGLNLVSTAPGADGKVPEPVDCPEVAETSSEDMVALAGLEMTEESAKKFKMIAIGFLLLFLLLSAAFLFVLLRMSKVRKAAEGGLVPTDPSQNLPE